MTIAEGDKAVKEMRMLSSKEGKGRQLYGPAVLLGSSLAAHFEW
eukprot:CAMPEP_0177403232 /NCGR_PEP_ID=MMETSP0368-20130122/60712_1 /TAXON_ID=447022 ORGANISM="Scrippsiella hangoei-like, Strain SHHI-4" /NCGR_SAMPLE_ID=MMETSP0368 /ASSEMBLY_ACC=CAM_ASM_000363 /LENGTH=43 /DNA_ID= /DNA_START= /DNA_END= /DNA_ORIENTATION=